VNPATGTTEGNGLLEALPQRERDGVLARCEHIPLAADEILGEAGERIRHAYFPTRGFVALLAEVDRHEALAMGLVGSEGMLGAPLVLGMHASPLRARVQIAGGAMRLPAADLARLLAESPALERQLRRYVGRRLGQYSRTAACASFHVVGRRLACWLLMAHDRAHGDRFYLTHDRLSRLLGVRRSGVTTAAGVLHGRELINYVRGHIVVVDRPGLERAACSCYRADHPLRLAPARTVRGLPGAGASAPTPSEAEANVVLEASNQEAVAPGLTTPPISAEPGSRLQGTRSRG